MKNPPIYISDKKRTSKIVNSISILFLFCVVQHAVFGQNGMSIAGWGDKLESDFGQAVLNSNPNIEAIRTEGDIDVGFVSVGGNRTISVWGNFDLYNFRTKDANSAGYGVYAFYHKDSNPSSDNYCGIRVGSYTIQNITITYTHKTLGTKTLPLTINSPWNQPFKTTLYTFTASENKILDKEGMGTANIKITSVGYITPDSFPSSSVQQFLQRKASEVKKASPNNTGSTHTIPSTTTNSTATNTTSNSSRTHTDQGNAQISNSSNNTSSRGGNTITYKPSDPFAYQKTVKNATDGFFNAEHDRIKKEYTAKEEREERGYLERMERKERERIENERLQREYEEEKRAKEAARNAKLDADYMAKGGYENAKLKEQAFKREADMEIDKINHILARYNEKPYRLTRTDNNCEYVRIIEGISLSPSLDFSVKRDLIYRVMEIRLKQQMIYRTTAKKPEVGHEAAIVTCANYLDLVAKGYYAKKLETNADWYNPYYPFTTEREAGVSNEGAGPIRDLLQKEADIDYLNPEPKKYAYHQRIMDLYLTFHRKPVAWSKFQGYNNSITDKQEIKKEAERYINLLKSMKKYGWYYETDYDNRLALFYYNNGQYREALDQFKIYVFNTFGSFENMVSAFNERFKGKSLYVGVDRDEYFRTIMLGTILYSENEKYKSATTLLSTLSELLDRYSGNGKIKLALLRNQLWYDIAFKQKLWDLIKVPTKNISYTDDNTYAAYVLIQKGDIKTAKKLFKDTYKKAQDRTYYLGTREQIEAFKTVERTLYPTTKKPIELQTATGYLISDYLDNASFISSNVDVYNRHGSPEYLKTSVIKLSEGNHETYRATTLSKEAWEKAFVTCTALYRSGNKFESNNDAMLFLEYYVDLGIKLLKLDEIVPAFMDLQLFKDEESLVFQESLLHYFLDHDYDKMTIDNQNPPTRESIKTIVEKDKEAERQLEVYLKAWTKQYASVTSPRIPYLYTLVEN